jgi:hypothetical protein
LFQGWGAKLLGFVKLCIPRVTKSHKDLHECNVDWLWKIFNKYS